MQILTIMSIIIILYLFYKLVIKFNSYTQKRYKYIFFSEKNLYIIAPAYVLLLIGYLSYVDALQHQGDTLNGLILLLFGLILLLKIIYKNFENTDFKIGILGTIFQLLVYVILTLFSVIVLIVVFVYYAQIRPVYNINSKN